nr:hypothetical protein [uncultured Oribacterium sp.]
MEFSREDIDKGRVLKMEKGKKPVLRKVGITALLLFSAFGLSACKPKYGKNETPVMTTAAANVEINMDFDQIHNDVVENMDPKDYPFVKSLNITGDNSTKMVTVTAEIMDNVSTEALNLFLKNLMENIANEAAIQDFRYTRSTDTEFGSFFKKYGVHYTITRGDETVEDVTVNPGDSFPFQG